MGKDFLRQKIVRRNKTIFFARNEGEAAIDNFFMPQLQLFLSSFNGKGCKSHLDSRVAMKNSNIRLVARPDTWRPLTQPLF
jgi:hypothetical protein